jgi:oxygen-independent coproporphyrinogen-3 oxidase
MKCGLIRLQQAKMRYRIEIGDRSQLANVEAALKIVDHRAEIVDEQPDLRLCIAYSDDFAVNVTAPELGDSGRWECCDREILDRRYSPEDRRQRLKERIRLGVIRVVGRYLGKEPAWGILSGVRPTKIFHYLRDKGFSPGEVRERLTAVYGMSPEKAELLVEVGTGQERFFGPRDLVGIYVGIPFCPTRCHYCSFAAVSLETHRHLAAGFLTALRREIEATAALCRQYGLTAESIYVGGGTPTSLEEGDFAAVMRWLVRAFGSGQLREFTVEAGRPETVTTAKLEAMVQSGVHRISINPQTMLQRTLDSIGRAHTVEQIIDAVTLVKGTPLTLNMDLILGLPGENGADFLNSLTEVIRMQPDNITVHTLAPKRAAGWRRDFAGLDLARDEDLTAAGARALETLRHVGYHPYYLYRQRLILADLENIGLAKPGKESIYNIQMMEERQTILGLGGGAVTKWLTGPESKIVRHQNPKCPATYRRRLEDDLTEKARRTKLLLY